VFGLNTSLFVLMSYSGTSLDTNLRRSIAWSKSQREVADLVTGSHSADNVEKWRKMRDDFDEDPSKPNPYEEVENRTSFFIFSIFHISFNPQILLWTT
jgi:hypothetical protein